MNTKNNKRRQKTRDTIERVFIEALQKKEIAQISVAAICAATGINRSTFYAHYADVYALADAVRVRLESEVEALYAQDGGGMYYADDWVRLFEHMRDNRLFYMTYFKLGYDQAHTVDWSSIHAAYPVFPQQDMEYHIEFFRAGFNALVKRWLQSGCRETPQRLSEILKSEYAGRERP